MMTTEQARSHGGARGGWAPPGKIWAPLAGLGCPPWHFIGIGIEVYSPPGILSAPPTNDTWLRRCHWEICNVSDKDRLVHDKLTHDKGCETGIIEFVVKIRVNDKPGVNARQRVVKRTPDS